MNIKDRTGSFFRVSKLGLLGFFMASLAIKSAPISFLELKSEYTIETSLTSKKSCNSADPALQETVFDLLNSLDQKKEDLCSYINHRGNSLQELLKELDITSSIKHPGHHLFSKINRTKTLFGQTTLLHMLANPLCNIKDLTERQNFIQELVTNQTLYNQVTEIVDQCKAIETSIIPLLHNKSPLTKDLKRFYFKADFFKALNNNAYALDLCNRYSSVLYNFALPALIAIAIKGLNSGAKEEEIKNNIIHNKENNLLYEMLSTLNPKIIVTLSKSICYKLYETINLPKKYNNELESINKKNSEIFEKLKQEGKIYDFNEKGEKIFLDKESDKKYIMPKSTKLFFFINEARIIGQILYATYNCYNETVSKTSALHLLKTSLIDLNKIYEIGLKAKEIGAENKIVEMIIPSYNSLAALANPSALSPLDTLKKSLDAKTFKNKTISYLPPDIGNVLLAYKNVSRVRTALTKAIAVIGQLDAYLSIAKLYKEFESERVHYCFAEYCENETPIIELEELWNPFVDYQKVTLNNLTLGAQNGPRNMILTGSNAGGKSTLTKGALYNLYLAQTICIAPSKTLKLTPFGYLGASLNVSDNQSNETSTFMAEAIRSKNLYKEAKKGTTNNFVFLIIDELYKGTEAKFGGPSCFIYGKKLDALKYTTFMFASHFTENVSKLEEETNGSCANFKLEVSPTERYKLKFGINTINTAPAILKAHFADIDPHFFDELDSI